MSKPEVEDEEVQRGNQYDAIQDELSNEDLEEAAGGKLPCFPELPVIPESPFIPPGPTV